MPDRERYRVDLEALPDAAPGHVRLKRALKCLLRSFGLSGRSVEQLQPPSGETKEAEPLGRNDP